MKKRTHRFIFLISFALLAYAEAWCGQPAVQPFPATGAWTFSFKPEVSYISYFLKGNVHDTLGYVRSMQGSASASIAADGRLTGPVVKLTLAADDMNSDDAARDKRMKKKFMETSLYPHIAFSSTGAGTVLKQAAPLQQASRERPIAFELEGNLKIHGTERKVTIPMTAYPEKGLLVVEGETMLTLKNFNIANPSLFIFRTEDNVKIRFHIELQPATGAES